MYVHIIIIVMVIRIICYIDLVIIVTRLVLQAAVIPPDLSLPYTFNRYRLKTGDHLTNVEIRSDFNYHGVSDIQIVPQAVECIWKK